MLHSVIDVFPNLILRLFGGNLLLQLVRFCQQRDLHFLAKNNWKTYNVVFDVIGE